MECVPVIKDDFCYAKRYRGFASSWSSAFSANIYLESGVPGFSRKFRRSTPVTPGR